MFKEDRWSGDGGGQEPPFEDVDDVAGLGSLPNDLQPEVRDFVRAMRGLFKATGKTLRQFAAYHHISAPSVSRYLSGKRLPDKSFIDALLKSACKAHEVDLSPEVQAYAYRLHREALLAHQPARYRLQMASDQLEEAILAREQAELMIRDLQLSVSDQKHELSRLERQKHQIERSAAEEQGRTAAEIEVYRGRQEHLEAQCSELREEINRLESELEQAERERDDALDRCAELELQLASVEEGAEREELEEELQEARREVADAADVTQERLTELQRAVQQAESLREQATRDAQSKREEAESLREQATRDAQSKREEADALFEETRAKAMQAAADFETNLAKRREQSERDLASRQQKADKRLTEIEHRAEQLRLEAEELRIDAERRARQTIEAAERQAAELHSGSASTTGQVPMAQEAPGLAADAAFKPFWFAVPEPRPLRPLRGQPTEGREMMLKPMTWYLAIGLSGNTLIAEDRTTGVRGILDDTSKLQRAQY